MKEFKDAIVQTTTKVIWSLSHAISFVSLCVVVFLFSCCQEKTEESSLLLGENEICFKEKLVSISKDGDDYYIGTESSGHIFVYSSTKDDVIDTLNTDYGRIYQVKKLHETDTFFVGTQNMGLKKTHQNGDSLITDIPYKIKGKGDRYSCYDIFFDNDTVYAMTSHGIFKVGKSDTLDSIFTHTDSNGVPNPLVANNMVKASGYLFAATDSGVVVIKNHEVVDTIAEKIKIKNVAHHNNFIYTLGDCLYKINPASLEVVDTVKLKASARYYFHADSIHHFLSDSYMVLAHDSVLHKPEQHKKVNTRRKLSLEGHNVIADGKEYSLLVAENALWQMGHHYPSVFGNLKKEGGVKLACTNGKSAYFLVGKKVYELGANNVAEEVLELKENGEIRLMECNLNGDSIYYVNNGDSVFRQSLKQGDPELIGKSDKEITAMCVHNSVGNGVILGVRDGLLYMEKQKIPEPITLEMNNGNKDTIPYIRRFAVTESNYYVPTMNEGIFFGKGKSLTFLGDTHSIQSIRDVVCPNPNPAILFWLTNKCLYLSSDDSVPNINYGSRLFVSHLDSDKVVCIPGELGGVRALKLNKKDSILKDTILFSDMAFRPESSLRLNDKLFLGGQSGIIAFNAKEIFDEKKSLNYNYVEFKDKENSSPNNYWIALITLIACVFGTSFVIVFYKLLKKRKEIEETRLRNVKDFFSKELNDFESNLQENEVVKKILRNHLQSIWEEIGNLTSDSQKDEISEKVSKLKKNASELSDLIDKCKDAAEKNKSKEVEIEASEDLDSVINEYKKILETEEEFAWYRVILENKEDPLTKADTIVDIEKKESIKIMDIIRRVLVKRTMTSNGKIEKLNQIIKNYHGKLVNIINNHIDDKIEKILKLLEEEKDKVILERIQWVYEQQKVNVEKDSDDIDPTVLFKKIKETTINDGRLEMVVQMKKIRVEIQKKEGKKLKGTIDSFYRPVIAYNVDCEIYNKLMEITKNEPNSPKVIRGKYSIAQQPFVILAMAMAESQLPEENNLTSFFKSKDYKYNDEDSNKDNRFIKRSRDITEKWKNNDYSKKLREEIKKADEKDSLSLYYSVTAYYLSQLAESK